MSSSSVMPPRSSQPLLQRLNSRGMMISRPTDEATRTISKRELSKRELNERKDPHDHSHWTAPPLAPKVMEPERHSKGTNATQRLQRVECIEIVDVVKRDGDDYYVINVFLQEAHSRIPTNQAVRHQVLHANHHGHHHGHDHNHSTAVAHTHDRKPDYTVERTFSEFEKLRHELRDSVQQIHRHYCNFCDGFLFMMAFSPAQPAILTRTLLRSTESRSKMLDKFLHKLLAEFQRSRPRCRFSCYATENLPVLLNDFLTGESQPQPQEADPASSPLATALW